jgi:hypothetical protein
MGRPCLTDGALIHIEIMYDASSVGMWSSFAHNRMGDNMLIEVTLAAGNTLLVSTHEEAWVLSTKTPAPVRCKVVR